ncbi:NAD(P)/FAD-dependent oxidoreductase [Hippea jasoniae]|uniref:NAD(P)/FAD-dependent oxidoreductase n=1 Tax=Hippea jasoniae TaxID=944479 RepID=UPI00054D952D|nr:FAD/NAD(P)-binding oxidoreductase [Hippea jasoniae]
MIAIIGGSIAAYVAYKTIKKIDRKAEVKIFSDELQKPYSKMLLPYMVKENIKSDAFFDIPDKDIVLNTKVLAIDSKQRVFFTSTKKMFYFSKLLIATGATPKVVHFSGEFDKEKIITIRKLKDIEVIRNLIKLNRLKSVTIVGGGLVGIEMADALIKQGVVVNLVVSSNRLLSSILSKTASDWLEKHILCNIGGLKIFKENDVEIIEDKNNRLFIKLKDNTDLESDLIIVAKGVKPNTELVDDVIKTNEGIVVDDYLMTTADGIFAAGDVVESYDLVEQKPILHAIWPVAITQAEIVAKNIMGKHIKYQPEISRNVVPVFGINIFSAGKTTDESLLAKTYSIGSFTQMFVDNNKICGITTIDTNIDVAHYLNKIKYNWETVYEY